jgi:hypothetical protein
LSLLLAAVRSAMLLLNLLASSLCALSFFCAEPRDFSDAAFRLTASDS